MGLAPLAWRHFSGWRWGARYLLLTILEEKAYSQIIFMAYILYMERRPKSMNQLFIHWEVPSFVWMYFVGKCGILGLLSWFFGL